MMSLRGAKRGGGNSFQFLTIRNGLLRYARNDGKHNSDSKYLSLRATKSRGNLFLNFIIILFLSTAPCQAAIKLDGINDHISIASLSISTPLTFSFWVNLKSYSSTFPNLISSASGNLAIGTTATQSFYASGLYFTASPIPLNVWVYRTYIISGGNISLYNNAIFVESRPFGITNFNGFTFGCYHSLAYFSNSEIDDVRIYNRPLTISEIESLYNSRSKRPSGSLANGLVAHFEMDDDSISEVAAQAKDSSGNLNHGQFVGFDNLVSNGFSTDVPTQIGTGHSLKFDGVNDYFSVANHTSLKPIDKITIGYWFKRNPGEKNQLGTFQSSSVANSDYVLQVYNDNYIYMSIPNGGSNQYFISTSTTIDTNWNFLYAVYDGTQTGNSNRLKVYLNGVLVPGAYVGTIPAVLNQGTLPIENRYNLNYTQGLMDDARIYNRALTASEISFLYNGSGLDPGTSNLQALWTFDEDSALKDSSGNDNHGVGVGGDSLKYTEGVLRR